MFALAAALAQSIVSTVGGIISKHVKDQDLVLKIQGELQMELMKIIQEQIEAQKAIIVAEATGKSWLQRNWRPLLMLVFTIIIAFNYIVAPLFSRQPLPIPPDMWDLLKIGIGGYIVGRSAEKIMLANRMWGAK